MMCEDAERVAGQTVLPRTRILYGQLQVTTKDKSDQVLGFSAKKEKNTKLT